MKIYKIDNEKQYKLLLKSGMFWEIYPELTGDWEIDKIKLNLDKK